LRIIIDDSGSGKKDKGNPHSPESKAGARLQAAGAKIVRQHMGRLQHNKMIIVNGNNEKAVVYGSTNFSWRGFYVQANNAVILSGQRVVDQALDAFQSYWDDAAGFRTSAASTWRTVPLNGIKAKISMSPHSAANAVQGEIAADIANAKSSVLYSLAFLYQTPGVVTKAIAAATNDDDVFVYGISDKETGILVQKPDGNRVPVYSSALGKNAPEPFKSEPNAGGGNKMHHKFVVIDFNKPSARVYTGSYNFSFGADQQNGENLILFRNRRIATAYMIEALRLVDHYHFRVAQRSAKQKQEPLSLKEPPRQSNHNPWWHSHFTDKIKIRDREMFA
jgi:phosphatidylserine/phosphatidylglycerophosphate/cardiolipin synthase-like enzyme